MKISHQIRQYRLKAKLSVRRLALLSGLAPETICKIENGKTVNVGVATLEQIASALGCELTDLLKEAA